MKILNERPIGMELNEYHAKQKEFKTWLNAYKKGKPMVMTIKNGVKKWADA